MNVNVDMDESLGTSLRISSCICLITAGMFLCIFFSWLATAMLVRTRMNDTKYFSNEQEVEPVNKEPRAVVRMVARLYLSPLRRDKISFLATKL